MGRIHRCSFFCELASCSAVSLPPIPGGFVHRGPTHRDRETVETDRERDRERQRETEKQRGREAKRQRSGEAERKKRQRDRTT